MKTAARLIAGQRAASLVSLLARAEDDESALVLAADALDSLAPLDRRRVIAAYGGAAYPAAGTRGQERPFSHITPRPPARHDPLRATRRHPRTDRMVA